ncbi:Armadillo repeat-containing protein [Drosera capensis]
MPSRSSSSSPTTPTALIAHITSSPDLSSSSSHHHHQLLLKSLRKLKNQIIGNRTKKLAFLKLGAVPAVVHILRAVEAETGGDGAEELVGIVVQAAAVIGSFACGVEDGARAVVEAGGFEVLYRLLKHWDAKVVNACARSLKMIYMSKLAPKYDFSKQDSLDFLLSLLNSKSESVTGLGASIITQSCQRGLEQVALCEIGVLKKLQKLLGGSVNQRDACLESLATLIKSNPVVTRMFVEADGGSGLSGITQLLNNRYPRGRLLACMCLSAVWNTSPSYLKDVRLKRRLIGILLELLSEPGQVGDESPFAFARLIDGNEEAQRLAFESGAVENFCSLLKEGSLPAKRIEGIFLALAELCAKLRLCRSKILSLKEPDLVRDALSHDSSEVRIAACICLRNVSRSAKSLCEGLFLNKMIMIALIRLLDEFSAVQVAALSAISNIVVNFAAHKSIFIQYGGAKQLIDLSGSMDSTVRLNAVRALKNLVFLVDRKSKEAISSELTASFLSSLICDAEPLIQEQALGFLRNLVDGSSESIDYVFSEDGVILQVVARQLRRSIITEIYIQGMYAFSNVATGKELHKEAVLHQLISSYDCGQSILFKFLQNNNNQLRTAAVWSVINLTHPSSPGASSRVARLRNAGIYSQLKQMLQDPCLDVKLLHNRELQDYLQGDHQSNAEWTYTA